MQQHPQAHRLVPAPSIRMPAWPNSLRQGRAGRRRPVRPPASPVRASRRPRRCAQAGSREAPTASSCPTSSASAVSLAAVRARHGGRIPCGDEERSARPAIGLQLVTSRMAGSIPSRSRCHACQSRTQYSPAVVGVEICIAATSHAGIVVVLSVACLTVYHRWRRRDSVHSRHSPINGTNAPRCTSRPSCRRSAPPSSP